jgi:hypothetical protein
MVWSIVPGILKISKNVFRLRLKRSIVSKVRVLKRKKKRKDGLFSVFHSNIFLRKTLELIFPA